MLRRRRFTRRSGSGARPSRAWSSLSSAFLLNSVTATTAVKLIELQSPLSLASLTADPPEDLTLLRLRGSFRVQMTANAVGVWTLALTVQDTDWTPGATFQVDADKRILWSRTYETSAAVTHAWVPPGVLTITGTAVVDQMGATDLDIAPRVKVEAGKALYLVGYENSGAQTLLVTSDELRVLYQRSGRRS